MLHSQYMADSRGQVWPRLAKQVLVRAAGCSILSAPANHFVSVQAESDGPVGHSSAGAAAVVLGTLSQRQPWTLQACGPCV